MRKLRLRKVMWPIQLHTISNRWNWGANPTLTHELQGCACHPASTEAFFLWAPLPSPFQPGSSMSLTLKIMGLTIRWVSLPPILIFWNFFSHFRPDSLPTQKPGGQQEGRLPSSCKKTHLSPVSMLIYGKFLWCKRIYRNLGNMTYLCSHRKLREEKDHMSVC